MAVVAPPPTTVERPGTGLLLAGWILGLIGVLISLGIIAWLIMLVIAYVGWFALDVLLTLFYVLGPIAWIGLIGFILGIIGTILVYAAWSRAKRGEPAGALGITGGVLLLISCSGGIGFIGGILAIIGGAQAR